MIIQLKDIRKLLSISIISFCAVFVCMLFMNFSIDIVSVKELITSEEVMKLYDAQLVMGKVISAISGGCLLLTSVVILFSYIKHYIDVHSKELGILKALGYSNIKIAKSFWIFGVSVFFGTALGFASSFILMPFFYKVMNEGDILPVITPQFNFILAVYLVILPTAFFLVLSIVYSYFKLKRPTLELIRGKSDIVKKIKKRSNPQKSEKTFLVELRRSTVRNRRSLVFFIAFASFCYSSMMQMSISMVDFGSSMFVAIIFFIGIILSSTTLLLAITTVVKSNAKHISIMKVFGYSFKECSSSILNGYRPVACIGFIIGTFYQYFLMKMVVSIFAATSEIVPKIDFDVAGFIVVLISFIIIYQVIMYCYSAKIKNISIKEIMLD